MSSSRRGAKRCGRARADGAGPRSKGAGLSRKCPLGIRTRPRAQQGEVGFTKKDELIPELEAAVDLLMPGSFSNVIRTPFGYHILKLIETKKGAALPFEKVKEPIKVKLFQIEAEKRYKSTVAKLRSTSYIEVKI